MELGRDDIISVRSTVASADGKEWSRARWSGITFAAADKKPAKALASMPKPQATKNAPKQPAGPPLVEPREPDGDGSITVTGDLKTWHKVTLDLSGPYAHELDNQPNAFTDHDFNVAASDATLPDFRARGRLRHVGKHHLQFAGDESYFIKAGADAPETLFGYKLPENDLIAEDWRSRDQSWDYARFALDFFRDQSIPFQDMTCRDELVGNPNYDNSRYCYAKEGEIYLVYLPTGGSTDIKLPDASSFSLTWFNPRNGELGKTSPLKGNNLTVPDKQDWLALIRE